MNNLEYADDTILIVKDEEMLEIVTNESKTLFTN